MEKLSQVIDQRMEDQAPYLWCKIIKTPSLFPDVKDKYRAITGVNPDGSIFSGNKLILTDEWEGVYEFVNGVDISEAYVPFNV